MAPQAGWQAGWLLAPPRHSSLMCRMSITPPTPVQMEPSLKWQTLHNVGVTTSPPKHEGDTDSRSNACCQLLPAGLLLPAAVRTPQCSYSHSTTCTYPFQPILEVADSWQREEALETSHTTARHLKLCLPPPASCQVHPGLPAGTASQGRTAIGAPSSCRLTSSLNPHTRDNASCKPKLTALQTKACRLAFMPPLTPPPPHPPTHPPTKTNTSACPTLDLITRRPRLSAPPHVPQPPPSPTSKARPQNAS